MRTIVVIAPGRLLVKGQDAIDEHGYIEFGMASRDGSIAFPFSVTVNGEYTWEEILEFAEFVGNKMLIEAYAEFYRNQWEQGRRGNA